MIILKPQNGFVSLFTCILLSLLLLIITVSLISLETLQLRKSEDAEQTLRAYYAAEAGIEAAVTKVLSNPTNRTNQSCQSNVDYDIDGAAGWTCQQISFSGNPTGKLDKPDEAKTVDPGRTSPVYNSVLVEWNQSSNTNPGFYNVNLSGGFPSQAAYNYASPLEISIVEYPNGGFAAGDSRLKLQNALLVPGGTSSTGVVTYSSLKNHGPWTGNCRPLPRTGSTASPWGASEYNCSAVITNFNTASNYIFRLRSRYNASSYKMTFKTGTLGQGNTVDVPDGTATIDVTAKAGQTYRRVVSKLPLNNGAAAGLNYVMYSDNDICKSFEVIDNVPQPGCPY